MQTYRYAAAFFAGAVLCILVTGYVAGLLIQSTAKDCELMGKFRHEGTVYTCAPQGERP
jgi:hypothetical protein